MSQKLDCDKCGGSHRRMERCEPNMAFWREKALAYGTEVLDLRYRIVELEAKLKECKCEGF